MKIVGRWGLVRYGILRSETGLKVRNRSEGQFLRRHKVGGRVQIRVPPERAADHWEETSEMAPLPCPALYSGMRVCDPNWPAPVCGKVPMSKKG